MSRFQINDIVLDIPPEQIHISRKSFNHQWQTLRTTSSIKAKSGFSTIDIVCNVKFTDSIGEDYSNGYEKLQALVAQFRVTPFCYVDNDFLRDSIVAGSTNKAMALALRALEVRKENNNTNVIEATFNFSWFNYAPYIHDFAYKQDIFMPTKAYDPRYSIAWKRLYRAEMKRNNYVPARYQGIGTGLGQIMYLSTAQYATVMKTKWTEVSEIERGVEELRARARLRTGAHVGYSEEADRLEQALGTSVTKRILEIIQSAGSSMFNGGEPETYGQLLEVLSEKNITPVIAKEFNMQFMDDDGPWSPVLTNKGDFIKLKSEPAAMEDVAKPGAAKGPEQILLNRRLSLDFTNLGIIPTGISIGFGNILATMPLAGHPYPTYQHVGSTDASVVISFTTRNREGIQALSRFYSISEDQARKFRNIPQGQKNIELTNEITQIFGLRDFIIEDLVTDTVPGQPGTYQGYITLINNPITAETREQISPGASFTTRFDIRNIISNILLDNLKLDQNIIKSKFGISGTFGVRERVTSPENAYHYSPKAGVATNDDRDSQFKELCLQYGQEFGKILSELILIVQSGYKSMDSGPVKEFFSLSNQDVVGIERLQADLYPIFKSAIRHTELGNTGLRTLGRGLDFARRDSAQAMKNQYNVALKALQRLEIDKENKSDVYQYIAESLQDKKLDLINSVAHFIDNYLDNWIAFATQFLDKIMLSGAIDLPQFKKAREAIGSNNGTSSAGCAYPDFPLAEVIQDLQLEDPQLYEQFKKYSNALELNMKNIGDEALLNPDFYFFDEIETANRLIGSEIINKSIESIKLVQSQDRPNAEKSFIEEEYTRMLGAEKARKIIQEANRTKDRDPEFFSDDRKDFTKDIENKLVRMSEGFTFYPDDLFPNSPLLCTLGEAAIQGNAISVDAISDKDSYFLANTRPGSTLQAPALAGEVQHDFGWEVIDYLSNHMHRPQVPLDSSQTPQFRWPTPVPEEYGGTGYRITSRFGYRTHPVTKEPNQWHNGIDICAVGAGNREKNHEKSYKTPVRAVADGEIYSITDVSKIDEATKKGVFVGIKHSDGWRSKYIHMQVNAPSTIALSEAFKRGEIIKVSQGQEIGMIGNTGRSTGPHLHFEISHRGKSMDPEKVLSNMYSKIQGPSATIDPNNESLLTRAIDQFEKDLHNGQGYSMARAYPAFKLYFIESDLGERKRYGFDDFFAYSAIKDISVIRSRKIAADLCIIQLTNVSGVLSNRRFQSDSESDKHRSPSGDIATESTWRHGAANTAEENPIASMMLQPGIQVQLRLGYNNHPEELEKVFNGVITDVVFSENDDLVEITCQSFAIELVQTLHGHFKTYGGFLSGSGRTGEILEDLMSYPEVVHFGHWEGGDATNTAYGALRDRWKFTPEPETDNIFAPTGRGWKGLLDSTAKYSVEETTIWDVFQEMTMRHPGYIASAVPYDSKWGPRMTMFFGCPEQMYFARDPTFKEDRIVEQLKQLVTEAKERTEHNRSSLERTCDSSLVPNSNDIAAKINTTTKQNIIDARDFWLKKLTRNFYMDRGITKSFRDYHVLTSTLHILHNDIASSSHSTFNTATIQYKNSMSGLGEKIDTAKETISLGLLDGKYKTFTLKCDAALPDEDVRELFLSYENCRGFEQAKRYALSTLTRSLREGYKGSVIIIGNPRIKPYDICYIFDEYSDMFGPIEVEQVILRFSQETGFITEITPDMVVNTNRLSGLSTADAMGLVAEAALHKIGLESMPSIVSTPAKVANVITEYSFAPIANMFFNAEEHTLGTGHSTNPFTLTGTFIFKKLLTRSQLAHPIRYSPLVKHGKPMLGGLPSEKVHGSFTQGIKKWAKDSDRGIRLLLSDTYDKFRISNWWGHWQGSATSILRGEIRSK